MTQRTAKIDSQIQHLLMELFQREMKDPRLGFVTVTRVETSRDLGHARIWVSVLGSEDERERSMQALATATPWLRRRVAEQLQLRAAPQLSIRHDEAMEAGNRVLELLHEIDREGRNE